MLRFLIGGFVIAHGLVTIAIWSPNPKSVESAPPIDTSRSWLLGDARSLGLGLAVTVGIAISVVGVAFLAHAQWWPLAALISGGLSLLLFGLFFTPWWLAGIAISGGLMVAALRASGLT